MIWEVLWSLLWASSCFISAGVLPAPKDWLLCDDESGVGVLIGIRNFDRTRSGENGTMPAAAKLLWVFDDTVTGPEFRCYRAAPGPSVGIWLLFTCVLGSAGARLADWLVKALSKCLCGSPWLQLLLGRLPGGSSPD